MELCIFQTNCDYACIKEFMDTDPDPVIQPKSPTPVIPVFVPPPTTSGRIRRFPAGFHDFLPNSKTPLPHMPKPTVQKDPTPTVNQPLSPEISP